MALQTIDQIDLDLGVGERGLSYLLLSRGHIKLGDYLGALDAAKSAFNESRVAEGQQTAHVEDGSFYMFGLKKMARAYCAVKSSEALMDGAANPLREMVTMLVKGKDVRGLPQEVERHVGQGNLSR